MLKFFISLMFFAFSSPVYSDTGEAIHSGCSGGFTGGGEGITVSREGKISRWRRPTWDSPKEETLIKTDQQLAEDLFSKLEEIKFQEIESKFNSGGDMICFITLVSPSGNHTVGWSGSSPEAVKEIYQRMNSLFEDKSEAESEALN